MKKNTAGQKIGCQMTTIADGSEFTGAVTVFVTGDAGTQAAGTVGSAACAHEGHGYHTYAPAQAETNYDLAAFTFVGTGAKTETVQVPTTSATSDTANIQAILDYITHPYWGLRRIYSKLVYGVASIQTLDKSGYQLSVPGTQAVLDVQTSALTTSGSWGKWLMDKLDVVLSTRLATSGYTAPPTAAANANAVLDTAMAGHVAAGTVGKTIADALAQATTAATQATATNTKASDLQNRTVAALTGDGLVPSDMKAWNGNPTTGDGSASNKADVVPHA